MKWIRKPLYIVLPALGFLIAWMANWFSPIDVAKVIWLRVCWVGGFLVSKFLLPGWVIILLMFAIPAIMIFIVALCFRTKITMNIVPYLSYNTDNFFGIDWYWKYRIENGKWIVDEETMTARCPNCKTLMDKFALSGMVWFECGHCGDKKEFDCSNLSKFMIRVVKEIDRKVVTGEYRGVFARDKDGT